MTRRRGKETREQLIALLLLAPAAPLIGFVCAAIKLEGLLDSNARGPCFYRETRISRGREIGLLKFRTLNSGALAGLGPGPTHIATLEKAGELTRVGRLLKQWYLDELPQLWNIVRGDMFLIGTRPYPVELYEEELARGITRKRDMPAGLIGAVQSSKGQQVDGVELDAEYWEEFQHASALRMLAVDARIVRDSLRVLREHKGI